MRTRLFFTIALLVLGALVLAACAPAEEIVPAENLDEVSSPDEVAPSPESEESYPAPEADVAAPPVEDAYPAPGEETEIYIPITGSEDAYPAPPDEPIKNPILVGTPYPAPGLDDLAMNLKPEDIVKFEDAEPRPEDKTLTPGNIYIESVEAITQVDETNKENDLITGPGLLITGYLPTPCNQLRLTVSDKPDENGNIDVVAYSVSDPGVMCIQVLQPFATFVPLTDLPAGQYTISINEGEQTVEMTIPE
jgi:hypothetical protein